MSCFIQLIISANLMSPLAYNSSSVPKLYPCLFLWHIKNWSRFKQEICAKSSHAYQSVKVSVNTDQSIRYFAPIFHTVFVSLLRFLFFLKGTICSFWKKEENIEFSFRNIQLTNQQIRFMNWQIVIKNILQKFSDSILE